MKKWVLWLMICALSAACVVSAAADGVPWEPVQARLVQKMATRSGPGTKYTEELGTYPDNTAITVISQAETNGLTWYQVEFSYSGRLYRAYTLKNRVEVRGSVTWENTSFTDDVTTGTVQAYYGPGEKYAVRWRQLNQGTQVKVVTVDGSWALCEYLEGNQWARGYIPVSSLKATSAGPSVPGTGTATRGGTRVLPIEGRIDRWQVPVKYAYAKDWNMTKTDTRTYMPGNAIDGRTDTCFQFSVSRTPLGEAYLNFEFLEPAAVDEIWIKNGNRKDMTSYSRSGRPKVLTVDFRYPGSAVYQDGRTIILQDDTFASDWQVVPLNATKKAAGIRFVIREFYWGSTYTYDVSVSEIMFVKK